MTELSGRAPRSAVMKFHESPSFVAIGDDESVSSRSLLHSREAPPMTELAQIGVTGLAVMGRNLARNFARHGHRVADPQPLLRQDRVAGRRAR